MSELDDLINDSYNRYLRENGTEHVEELSADVSFLRKALDSELYSVSAMMAMVSVLEQLQSESPEMFASYLVTMIDAIHVSGATEYRKFLLSRNPLLDLYKLEGRE